MWSDISRGEREDTPGKFANNEDLIHCINCAKGMSQHQATAIMKTRMYGATGET